MVWIPRDGEHALRTSSWSRGTPEAMKMTAKRATPPNPARVGALRVSSASKSHVLLCSRPPTQASPFQLQTTPRPPLGREMILGILQNFGPVCPSPAVPPPPIPPHDSPSSPVQSPTGCTRDSTELQVTYTRKSDLEVIPPKCGWLWYLSRQPSAPCDRLPSPACPSLPRRVYLPGARSWSVSGDRAYFGPYGLLYVV